MRGSGGENKSSSASQQRQQRRRDVARTAAACVFAGLGVVKLANLEILPGRLGGGLGIVRRLSWDVRSGSTSRPSRSTSVALPGGGCRITSALKPREAIAPTFVASYPGSGSKMTWNLVQALTGLVTGDEHGHNAHPWSHSVTVKSHFPHSHGNADIERTSNEDFPRAVLMLRHPADAIPSFHNFLYEYENGLPDHSTRAPLDVWLTWRDGNLETQLREWEEHTTYWMERYPHPEDRLMLTFEGMTDDTWGPESARSLSDFLARTPGVDPIEDGSVECVWRKIILYKVRHVPKPTSTGAAAEAAEAAAATAETTASTPESTKEDPRRDLASTPDNPDSRRSTSGGGLKKFRPYTTGQLGQMRAMLQRLRTKFGRDADLCDILDLYLERLELLKMKTLGVGFVPNHRRREVPKEEHAHAVSVR